MDNRTSMVDDIDDFHWNIDKEVKHNKIVENLSKNMIISNKLAERIPNYKNISRLQISYWSEISRIEH